MESENIELSQNQDRARCGFNVLDVVLTKEKQIGNVLIIVFATVNGTDHTTRVILFLYLSLSLYVYVWRSVHVRDDCFTCTRGKTNRKESQKNK